MTAFRWGVCRATVKRERTGLMFDHDDVRQEIAEQRKKRAASLFLPFQFV